MTAFAELRDQGKVRAYGVSNFGPDPLAAARAAPHGAGISANQVYYNLRHRGIEHRLLRQCQAQGILVMAYTPLDQGRLDLRGALARVAARHRCTPEQVALAFTIRLPGVVTIPKAADPAHVRANAQAAALHLTPDDLAELEAEFPRPVHEGPLETV